MREFAAGPTSRLLAAEMLSALAPLQQLTGRGLSVLVDHHPRKGRLVSGQAARGSGALSGYAEPRFARNIKGIRTGFRQNPGGR